MILLCLSLFAVPDDVSADAADLSLSISPAQPSSVDRPTLTADVLASYPSTYPTVEAILTAAGGPGCGSTPAATLEHAFTESPPGYPIPATHLGRIWVGIDGSATNEFTNLAQLPPGEYIYCGYLYEEQFRPGMGLATPPDVGPVTQPFTVRAPESGVSLSAYPASLAGGETLHVVAPYQVEPGYTDSPGYTIYSSPLDGTLDVNLQPNNGQGCPAAISTTQVPVLGTGGEVIGYEEKRGILTEEDVSYRWVSEANPNEIDSGTFEASGPMPNLPAGSYVLCAYIDRIWDLEPPAVFLSEAHSEPVYLTNTGPAVGGDAGETEAAASSGGTTKRSRSRESANANANIGIASGVALVRRGRALLSIYCRGASGHCSGVARLVARQRGGRKPRRGSSSSRHKKGSMVTLGQSRFQVVAGKKDLVPIKLKTRLLARVRSGRAPKIHARLLGSGLRSRPVTLKLTKPHKRQRRGKHSGRAKDSRAPKRGRSRPHRTR